MSTLEPDTDITASSEPQTDDFVRSLTQYSRYSIRRTGSNDEYQAQDLPFARYPSKPGVVYRAGTEVGGRRCPRCPDFIAVRSRVVRLPHPERGKWWVHERCYSKITVDLRDCTDCEGAA